MTQCEPQLLLDAWVLRDAAVDVTQCKPQLVFHAWVGSFVMHPILASTHVTVAYPQSGIAFALNTKFTLSSQHVLHNQQLSRSMPFFLGQRSADTVQIDYMR